MPAKIPHDPLTQKPVHITYRLLGSVPKQIEEQLKLRRDKALSLLEEEIMMLPEVHRSQERYKRKFVIEGKYEMALDDALHSAALGSPMYLNSTNLAKIIIDSWLFLQRNKLVFVYAVCVMGNHVHVVVRAPNNEEEVNIGHVMARHKGFTSLEINKQLDRTGQGLWEKVYFDRRIRNGKFNSVMWYVLNNPVKSGQVKDWRDWPSTYLNPEYDLLFKS